MADTITDGLKHDGGKLRLDLVPPELIEAVGAVRTYGIHKYKEEYSYRKVEPKRYRAALMRHICKWLKNPYGIDEDSGLPHLWHIACNVAFLIELDGERTNEQLQVNSGSRQTYIENIDVAHIKSEAIREFAERLKTEIKSDLYGDDVMPRGTIDWLVRKMTEGNDAE